MGFVRHGVWYRYLQIEHSMTLVPESSVQVGQTFDKFKALSLLAKLGSLVKVLTNFPRVVLRLIVI